MRSDHEGFPTGNPLDLFTPLRDARDHATKSLVALVLASVSVFMVLLHKGELLGWPRIDYRVGGEAVGSQEVPGGTVVTFAGRGGGQKVRWSRFLQDSSWEMGQEIEGWIDEGGRFHADYGLGWAGPPTSMFLLILAPFVLFAARRLLALWVAWWDPHPQALPNEGWMHDPQVPHREVGFVVFRSGLMSEEPPRARSRPRRA